MSPGAAPERANREEGPSPFPAYCPAGAWTAAHPGGHRRAVQSPSSGGTEGSLEGFGAETTV